jgi:predicted nucleotidyltransferase
MRISCKIKEMLVDAAKRFFGDDCKVYLFGSRVDDSKNGGDIDIFIETVKEVSIHSEIDFLVEVEKNITSRHVDLVVKTPSKKHRKIFETAKKEGVLLC